jgi:hypothetical protein
MILDGESCYVPWLNGMEEERERDNSAKQPKVEKSARCDWLLFCYVACQQKLGILVRRAALFGCVDFMDFCTFLPFFCFS